MNGIKREYLDRLQTAFLKITDQPGERMAALRFLTLYMLKGFSPAVFNAGELSGEFNRLLARFNNSSVTFDDNPDPNIGMSRVDICYVLHHCRYSYKIDVDSLASYLQHLMQSGELIYAWLCGEMIYQCGIDLRIKAGLRPYKDSSKIHDLYWLTHQFLLATNYLHKPLSKFFGDARVDELIASIDWLIDEEQIDLANEVAFCLQLANKHLTKQYGRLIDFIKSKIAADGLVILPSQEQTQDNIAHATAGALLVFVGINR